MLSVLVATHNGSDTIERTLAAMAELDPPAGGWKLVVVNNASTDDTEALVLKWRDRLPLEYVVEPRLGKPFALNTALKHAEGDFFVLTDDDVLPVRHWLLEWRRVADAYPQCSVFGGAIVSHFDDGAPPWANKDHHFGILYGETWLKTEGEVGVGTPGGANMGLRRNVYEDGWRFDETFMRGASGLMGEDTDLTLRLKQNGYRYGFAPDAEVGHIIQSFQKSPRWMRQRFYRYGRAEFMHDVASGAPSFPRWRVRRAMELGAGLIAASIRGDGGRAFDCQSRLACQLGALHQAISVWRARKTGAAA